MCVSCYEPCIVVQSSQTALHTQTHTLMCLSSLSDEAAYTQRDSPVLFVMFNLSEHQEEKNNRFSIEWDNERSNLKKKDGGGAR